MFLVSGRRLKIDGASVNDSGWYSCEGFNDYGHQTTSAYLLIIPGTIRLSTYHTISVDECSVKYIRPILE